MNNKRLGIEFEREVCDILNRDGWWVHFISPDIRGAQPFDIIACKDCVPIAIDCKTSKERIFRISRLEHNQILAFEKWKKCVNNEPVLFVRYNGGIKIVSYSYLCAFGKVDLEKCYDYSGFWRSFI